MTIDHSSKIRRQIYTGFGLIVLLIAFLGAISLIEINYLGSLTTTVYNHPLKVSNSALRARVSVVSMHRYMKDVVLAEDHESFEQAINKVETEGKQVLLNLDVIKKLILGSEGESLERKARQTFIAWKPIRAEVIQLVKNGDIKKAAQITQRRGADHEFELAQQMLNLASYAQEKADGFIQQSFQAKNNFSILTVITVFLGAILSILIGFSTLKKVLKSHQARINIENTLRKNEERYRLLTDNAKDMIYRMSLPDGQYEYVSPASIELFGYSPSEFYTSPVLIAKLIHPDWKNYFEEQWARLIAGDMALYYEYQIVHKSGEVRWIHQRNVLVKDNDGKPIAIEAIASDLTERKNAEVRLRESNEELDAFVHTVAHDLRNPLSPILGYAEILREDYKEQLDEQGLSCLAEIEKAGTGMLDLMEGLLSLAQSGTIKRPIKFVSTDEVVATVIKTLETNISTAGAILQVNPLPPVRMQKTFLIQIFDNLIDNAVRYASKSGGLIEVGGEQRGNQVRYFVRDHGPGVSEEERKHVFEIVYRGKSKEDFKGSGIGLAIVYKLARNCGGRAWVEETPGGGCTFWVEIDDEPQD